MLHQNNGTPVISIIFYGRDTKICGFIIQPYFPTSLLQGSNSFPMEIESWKIFLFQEQFYTSMWNVHHSKQAIFGDTDN